MCFPITPHAEVVVAPGENVKLRLGFRVDADEQINSARYDEYKNLVTRALLAYQPSIETALEMELMDRLLNGWNDEPKLVKMRRTRIDMWRTLNEFSDKQCLEARMMRAALEVLDEELEGITR